MNNQMKGLGIGIFNLNGVFLLKHVFVGKSYMSVDNNSSIRFIEELILPKCIPYKWVNVKVYMILYKMQK